MRTKQQGDVLIAVVFVLILVTVTYLAYRSEHMSLSIQEVRELDQKCKQQHGELVVSVNNKQQPKFAQCKLGNVLYNKF